MNDTPRTFCHQCGTPLTFSNGSPVYALVDYHGNTVRMHKGCAKRFEEDKPLTVQTREEPPRDE